MRTIEAAAVISARDKTGRTFAQIAGKMAAINRAQKQINRTTALGGAISKASMSAQASALAIAARYAGPAALGGALAVSAKRYMTLEAAITDLGITTDATDEQIARAQKTLQRFAPEIGKTGEETVEVTRLLAAAGMEFNEAVAATPTIAKAAVATGAALNDMATAGYAAMEQLGISVDDLGKALEEMAVAGKLGRFEVKDMAREFPSLAASAAKLKFHGIEGVAELAAMLQVVRKTSGTSEEAANNLNDAMQKVFAPQTERNFAKKGVKIGKVLENAAKRGENGFVAVIDTVKEMTKGLNDTARAQLISQLFPDKQARAAVNAMIDFRDVYAEMVSEIRSTSGVIDRDLARRLATAQGKIDQMTASLDRAATAIGGALAPAIGKVADELRAMVDDIESRDGGLLSELLKASGNVASGDKGGILGNISAGGQEIVNFDDLLFGKTPDKARRDRLVKEMERADKMAETLAIASLATSGETAADLSRRSAAAAEVARRRRQTLGPMAARDMSGVAAGNAEVERLRAEKAARTLVSATDAAGAAFESAADKIVRGRDMIAKAAADLEKLKALSPAERATMPTAAAIDRRRRIGERYQAEAAETLARLNQSVEGRAVIYSAAQSAAPMASSPAGGARAASELQGLENLKAVVEGPITAELTGQASIS
ncbi:MAG TPA: phage tail tape measure protein, partial [Hyphomicrobiales bacterium]|nr:phage tail tape measure protein [Hyphomicrobiales bacterium]